MDIVKEIEDLMIVTCDVSTSAGLDRFKRTYPENYIDVGIAEQNMIGMQRVYLCLKLLRQRFHLSKL